MWPGFGLREWLLPWGEAPWDGALTPMLLWVPGLASSVGAEPSGGTQVGGAGRASRGERKREVGSSMKSPRHWLLF